MAGALTQSNSNPINYNKMAGVNINRINYINLAWAETQSIELYLVFIEGGDSLYRIPPLQPKKKSQYFSSDIQERRFPVSWRKKTKPTQHFVYL